MNGETETASLAQEKKKKRERALRDTRPELDEIAASPEQLLHFKQMTTLELIQISSIL